MKGENGKHISMAQWCKRNHSMYTGCKSHGCHSTFAKLYSESEWSEEVCSDCQIEIEKLLIEEEFEQARTRLRQKKLHTDDVPSWLWKAVEEELDLEHQTLEQFGEDVYENVLELEDSFDESA